MTCPLGSNLLRPANGGRTCVGATYQFQMCNTNECEDIYNDPREEQCRTWEPDFELHSNKHHWLPYEHPDRECTHPPSAVSTHLRQQIRAMRHRGDSKCAWNPKCSCHHGSCVACFGALRAARVLFWLHVAVLLRTAAGLDYTIT